MEQIVSVFGVNWKLVLIQMVNFGLLLAILYRFLYKPVLGMIDERREKIANAIRKADQMESDFGEAELKKAELIREATQKGDAIIDAAKKHAEVEEHNLIKDAHRKVAHLLNEAERRAARERETILEEAEREVARMAVLAAEKVLRKR